MDSFPDSEMGGFLPPMLCERVCHCQPYFYPFDRKERSGERFVTFSIRKCHGTNQSARRRKHHEKLGLNERPIPQAFAISCRQCFQLGAGFFGFLAHRENFWHLSFLSLVRLVVAPYYVYLM